MKKKNPPKKLRLFKNTIAHLNNEQLNAARGGTRTVTIFCGPNSAISNDCETDLCVSQDCKITEDCA